MKPEKVIPKNLTDKAALILSVAFLLLYLSTLSMTLEEEDSAHFALALTDFNVTKYQPHPPGFPVYIALGKVFYSFTGNEVTALTSMSAFFGALSFLVTYLLFREMAGREKAIAASVLTAVTPLFWLNSLKALSDMTGLFFTLLTLLMLYTYMRNGCRYLFFTSAFLTGLSMGVRIHSAFVLIPAMLYVTFTRKSDSRTNLNAGIMFVIGALAWFLPLLAITGPADYLSVAFDQLGERVGRPEMSLIGTGSLPSDSLAKAGATIYYFLFGGYGVNLGGMGILSIALLSVMVLLSFLSMKRFGMDNPNLRFIISALVLYVPVVFIMLTASNPRYFLVLVPFVSLLFVEGSWKFRKTLQRYLLLIFLASLLLAHSSVLAVKIHTVESPMFQMTGYINENYDESAVVIVSGFSDMYFRYYGIRPVRIPAAVMTCEGVESLLQSGRNVLSTAEQENCDGLVLKTLVSFSRDARVHVKRSRIDLFSVEYV